MAMARRRERRCHSCNRRRPILGGHVNIPRRTFVCASCVAALKAAALRPPDVSEPRVEPGRRNGLQGA